MCVFLYACVCSYLLVSLCDSIVFIVLTFVRQTSLFVMRYSERKTGNRVVHEPESWIEYLLYTVNSIVMEISKVSLIIHVIITIFLAAIIVIDIQSVLNKKDLNISGDRRTVCSRTVWTRMDIGPEDMRISPLTVLSRCLACVFCFRCRVVWVSRRWWLTAIHVLSTSCLFSGQSWLLMTKLELS